MQIMQRILLGLAIKNQRDVKFISSALTEVLNEARINLPTANMNFSIGSEIEAMYL
jgi:hypothetical protein